MKILFALTYYSPHISGLTIYARRLAEALAARGHEVSVLTSQHDARLPREEHLGGVRIERVPIGVRVSKGAVMRSYARRASELLRTTDVLVLNLPATPQEAVVLPLLARAWKRRPIVAIYYCDVQLPGSFFNRVVNKALALSNIAAGKLSDRVVSLTDDYARHSPFLRRFKYKLEIIRPSVLVEPPDPEATAAFRLEYAPDGERLVGLAARFAAEKGVEYLLDALPRIREQVGDVRILFTGEARSAVGEEKYWSRVQPLLEQAGDACAFLGTLDARQLATFYAACDVTVLPSVNSTEAFGLVQLESMLCGTPVVASDLPGVRVPVQTTGMGLNVPPRDAAALADSVVEVIRHRARYVRERAEVERQFPFETMVDEYEALFERVVARRV
ncbi:MAG TPA: glycosyltransferase family 4 protein [Pyrinomonadaceae bacterium]|nr:glycosyltransferase family 4 protein [Pyrinomonadaceae bacterium]